MATEGNRTILGIDPGTAIMGYGIVTVKGETLEAVEFGAIKTAASQALTCRLRALFEGLTGIVDRFRPGEVAVEQLFFARNVDSALAVGHARGVALLVAALHDLPVGEYTPLQVKQSVAGYGRATKEQIQKMVALTLALNSLPQPDDAADALAVAICHARWNERIAGGKVQL